ncbi:MAG: stage V sporulation protein AC [Ruminococcaceae bacterium]|nr:stage V sporulation protein AC [Oscillospiraceae bacterium]MBD5115922.1 stage V sporulation protein AC [Oscillospiraceae bacterium]
MKMTNTEYDELTKKHSPNTKLYLTLPKAFVIGGLICCLGQALFNLYTYLGMTEMNARSVTSITLIFFSALLTGLKLYDKIAKHGGAGTLVPITGFANSVVSPALEFKTEGFILGTAAKMFIIAGPVIVYGIVTSVLYGIILYIFQIMQ